MAFLHGKHGVHKRHPKVGAGICFYCIFSWGGGGIKIRLCSCLLRSVTQMNSVVFSANATKSQVFIYHVELSLFCFFSGVGMLVFAMIRRLKIFIEVVIHVT